MLITLFEDQKRNEFLPLVYTRPVGDLRVGILRLSEKWEKITGHKITHTTTPWLQSLFSSASPAEIAINARCIPDKNLSREILDLKAGTRLVQKGETLAVRFKIAVSPVDLPDFSDYTAIEYQSKSILIERITDLIGLNAQAIESDFELITQGRKSAPLQDSNTLIGPPGKLFIEDGATVHASVINTSGGSVYIGKNAEVMEGSLIRGPFALCDNSTLKLGTKIYGPVSIGPFSKVGGEISSTIISGFSNKAHDGFLGHSLIGEWCNLGAGTNNSNLKNNYSEVSIWHHHSQKMVNTGLTFCGLIMGDYSRCSINTMFNTGTVVDVGCNVIGGSFGPKYVPSFTWSGDQEYELSRAFETIRKIMARRDQVLTDELTQVLTEVYEMSGNERSIFLQRQGIRD